MSDHSKIATWNPVRGCTKISPGCKHCYAETFAERFRGVLGHPYERGFDLRLVPEKLNEPLLWSRPKTVFVNSMSDVFHSDVPDEYIEAVAKVMQAIQASRLFRREVERDVLGKEQPVTGFRHELIGKFLAARHVRHIIGQGAGSATVDYITLSGDELWLDMFYFVIDETVSSALLNRFLKEILAAGGLARERIAAYAIGTKGAQVATDVRVAYEKAKLGEDLALTPAA